MICTFIEPSFEIIDSIDGESVLKKIERCGRTCYKSEDKITDDSCKKFVKAIVNLGHESVLEHVSITVKFTISRAIANEIVRHRIASYSQESTRYCNYKNCIQIVIPESVGNKPESLKDYKEACTAISNTYELLLNCGCKPEIARGILPNDLKTELVMTANLREWRHFFKLRCARPAHPELRRVTIPLLFELQKLIPIVFDDIEYYQEAR